MGFTSWYLGNNILFVLGLILLGLICVLVVISIVLSSIAYSRKSQFLTDALYKQNLLLSPLGVPITPLYKNTSYDVNYAYTSVLSEITKKAPSNMDVYIDVYGPGTGPKILDKVKLGSANKLLGTFLAVSNLEASAFTLPVSVLVYLISADGSSYVAPATTIKTDDLEKVIFQVPVFGYAGDKK